MSSANLKNEEGAVLALLTVVLLPLVALVALALDVSRVLQSELQRQANCEYAAQVALMRFKRDSAQGLSFDVARQRAFVEAQRSIRQNSYLAGGDRNEVGLMTLQFGRWDDGRFFRVGSDSSAVNSARVLLGAPQEGFVTYFAAFFGFSEFRTTTEAVAEYDQIKLFDGKMPVEVVVR